MDKRTIIKDFLTKQHPYLEITETVMDLVMDMCRLQLGSKSNASDIYPHLKYTKKDSELGLKHLEHFEVLNVVYDTASKLRGEYAQSPSGNKELETVAISIVSILKKFSLLESHQDANHYGAVLNIIFHAYDSSSFTLADLEKSYSNNFGNEARSLQETLGHLVELRILKNTKGNYQIRNKLTIYNSK